MASKFAAKFTEHCNKAAHEIAKNMVKEIYSRSIKNSERESFIAFILSDELEQFFFDTLKLQMSDPDGAKWLNKLTAKRIGITSGAKRWNKSLKLKFLVWALAENARNPELSKNAIAERYAREHPGTSVATLRRYLSKIPRG